MNDTEKFLIKLIDSAGEDQIEVNGPCQHCKTLVRLDVDLVGVDTIEANGNGGCRYYGGQDYLGFLCSDCHDKGKRMGAPTEIYSRPCGYLSPTRRWNKGKVAEFAKRTYFNTDPDLAIPTA